MLATATATMCWPPQISRLARQLAGVKGSDQEAVAARSAVEEAAAKLEADLAAANKRQAQLEGAQRNRWGREHKEALLQCACAFCLR